MKNVSFTEIMEHKKFIFNKVNLKLPKIIISPFINYWRLNFLESRYIDINKRG